ncbi:MAG TPA: carotenoid oxygenase family protein [Gemmataceae bacterium]|nr:carotenoid oxygenase family protein [Gemmataceae bacterium]
MSDRAPGLECAFALTPVEDAYDLVAEGDLPAYVRGTYYLNGPARFARGELRYRHWLDGDGMVCGLRFGSAGTRFTCRYVRGPKFVAEEIAGRPLFRAFGTAFPGDRLRRGVATESPLNVSVYPYRDRLLAFGEQSLPLELDPDTLATRGPYNFDGQLNEFSPFSAHPKFDRATGEMLNFGIWFDPREPALHLYRFAGDGQLASRTRAPLPYACAIHDFALTPRHAVFYLSPHVLDVAELRAGRTTLEALSWEPDRGSRLLLVARDGGAATEVPIGRRYCLHVINAFEASGRLTADVIEFDRPVYDEYLVPDLFSTVSPGRPVRYVVDVATGVLLERREFDYARAPDFPAIDPRDAGRGYRDFWMLGIAAAGRSGRKFFDRLARGDWDDGDVRDDYRAPPRHYLAGEPAFVPDPRRPRAAVVVCPVFDAESVATTFAVFDAYALASGPIARLRLRAPIHLGFHATFHEHSG